MRTLEVAGLRAARAELVEDGQALAIHDDHVRVAVVGQIHEALRGIRRERDPGHRPVRRPAPVDERLRLVLPVEREHLHAAVLAIGHVDEIVVRHPHRVDRAAELLRALPFDVERRAATATRGGLRIDRRVAEGAPHALERAGVGVEHDDPAIAVAVGHEQLVGLRIDEGVGRLVDAARVGVAAALVGPADLQQELPVLAELHEHVVGPLRQRVGRGALPPIHTLPLVVHVHAVLAVGPVEARRRAAPGAQELAIGVELEQRRRRLRPLRLGHGPRPVQHPDVVLPIHGNARHLAQHPVVGQLRPRGVHLEHRHRAGAAGLRRGGFPDGRDGRDRHEHDDCGAEDTSAHGRPPFRSRTAR